MKVAGRCYTLDVNPTSGSRVKVRLYETRPVEAGGNILLLQGQLSVKQFQALEALFLAGAAGEGTEVVRLGRFYTLPPVSVAAAGEGGNSLGRKRSASQEALGVRRGTIRLVENTQPRAPSIRGPVIGPDGVVEDDGSDEGDYDTLAYRHVERLLRRQRARAG